MKIRQAGMNDIPRIAEIERDAFPDPWTEQALRAELENGMGIFLAAADENDQPVGYIIGTQDGSAAFVNNIAVAPEMRRQGAGRLLLEGFVSVLPAAVGTVSLEVRASNIPAQALYLSFGFRAAGVRKRLYSFPTEDGIVMVRQQRISQKKEG